MLGRYKIFLTSSIFGYLPIYYPPIIVIIIIIIIIKIFNYNILKDIKNIYIVRFQHG